MSLPALTSRQAEAAQPRGLRAPRLRSRRVPRGLPFILPYLPFLIAFGVAPMLYALDLAFTNGHPRETPANIYFARYRHRAFYRADGSRIESLDSLPMRPSQADEVYDARRHNGVPASPAPSHCFTCCTQG